MFAHLARASFGLKLNCKYKTIYRGIHYKQFIFNLKYTRLSGKSETNSLCEMHKAVLYLSLSFCTSTNTCVRCACFACFMSVSALYEWLWNINRSTFQMKKKLVTRLVNTALIISENITVRRFIMSGSLHYYSKTRDYSNAIKLKMCHRAKKITVKVTKTCKIHFNEHN